MYSKEQIENAIYGVLVDKTDLDCTVCLKLMNEILNDLETPTKDIFDLD